MRVLRQLFSRRADAAGLVGIIGTAFLMAALYNFLRNGDISFVPLLVGIVGVSLWLVFAPDDLRGWLSGRQAGSFSTSLVLLVLFTAFVVIIYDRVNDLDLTVDFTDEQAFTLNTPSLLAIENARAGERQVQITAFYSRLYLREREAADIILRQYDEQGGDKIEVVYVDPDDEPLLARTFAYNSLEDKTDAIYISYLTPEGAPDLPTIRYIGSANEREISRALLDLVTLDDSVVYFTTGHNELQITSQAGTGLSRATNVLGLLNIRAGEINLLTDDIPDDAAAIIIAGPSTPFDPTEVEKLAEYVENDGRLMIMANPPFVDSTFGGTSIPLLEANPLSDYLWQTFGFRFRDDLVVDFESSFDTEFIPVPDSYNSFHEILFDFSDNTAVILPLARSIEFDDGGDYILQELMLSSSESYGERELQLIEAGQLSNFDPDVDVAGPLAFAATAREVGERETDTTTRVILMGDVDWVTNDFIARFDGNALLWANMVEWIAGNAERTRIDAVIQRDLLAISATEQERQRISVFTTVIMPMAVLALGAAVWFLRRRR